MEKSRQFKRRDIIKKVGVMGGAATVGMSGPVTAAPSSTDDVGTLLETPRVQSIIEAIPSLRLQPRRAEGVEFRIEEEDPVLKIFEIPANFGRLFIGEAVGEDYREVMFSFKNRRPNLDFDWPRGSNALLIGQESEAVLFREPTDDELAAVLGVTEKTEDEVEVYTHSGQDGFTVVDNQKNEDTIEVFQVGNSNSELETLATSNQDEFIITEHREIQPRKDNDLITLSSDCNAGLFAINGYLCIQDIGVCVLCGSVCASTGVTTVAGVIGCFICLAKFCGVTMLPKVGSCNYVGNCIGEFTDEVEF